MEGSFGAPKAFKIKAFKTKAVKSTSLGAAG